MATGRYYRPELDVLRFIAFLLVWFTHRMDWVSDADRTAHPWFAALSWTGGFGVPVFFLLSAFLITELLMRERERTGTVHPLSFYVRRMLRIWPLYFGWFALTTALSYFVDGAGEQNPSVWLAFLFFAGNWYITFNHWIAYPLSPLWSIPVEEQFYLGIPFLAHRGRRALIVACAICIVVAYITIAIYAPIRANGRGGVWTNSLMMFQFFATGCLLSLGLHGRTPHWHPLLRLLGIAATFGLWLVAFSICGVRADDPQTTLAGALIGWALVLAGVVLLFLSLLGTPGKWLPAPLVYLGRISYGLYVFHAMMYYLVYHVWKDSFIALGFDWPGGNPIGAALAMGMTIVLATLSYRFYEGPFLRLKRRFTFIPSRD